MAEKEVKFRDRKFRAVLYPEDPTHEAAIKILENSGYSYAYILHDKDVEEDGENAGQLKKPHWHVVIRFPNAVWNTALAKTLGITPNYLRDCETLEGSLMYIVHANEACKHKYQYDVEEVKGPLQQKLLAMLRDDDEGTRALQINDIIERSPGKIGYSELLKKAVAAGLYSDLRRMGQFAVYLVREHNDEYYYSTQNNAGTQKDAENFRAYEAHTGTKDIKPL